MGAGAALAGSFSFFTVEGVGPGVVSNNEPLRTEAPAEGVAWGMRGWTGSAGKGRRKSLERTSALRFLGPARWCAKGALGVAAEEAAAPWRESRRGRGER